MTPEFPRSRQASRQHSHPPVACQYRRLSLEVLEDRSLLSVFVVTNVNDAGAGSLRQAILSSNATPGLNQIDFSIGGGGAQTISPLSALPRITNAVVIDGTTQAGYAGKPLIELDGLLAGAAANGLWASAGNTTIRGLIVDRFTADGVKIDTAGNDTVQGNYIGTDPTGTAARGNGGYGVDLVNASSARIGGTAAGQGNVISGNASGGINVAGGGYVLASEDNYAVKIDARTGAVLATYATGVATGSAIIGADGSLYVGDYYGNQVLHFDASGNALPSFGAGHLTNPQDMIFGPDGNLYVGGTDGSVQKFDPSGNFLGTFVSAGSGGLSNAKGMAFGPDGNFYVASYGNNSILRYDGQTGAFLNVFTSGSGGLSGPEGIAFGPDGNLYVSSFATKQVLRYDGTGAFLGAFVNGPPGLLNQVYGLAFDAAGDLQVVSEQHGTIRTYDGTTGAFLHTLASGLTNPQFLTAALSNNVIQGNYIGTDASGVVAIPNQNYGIVLSASDNTVGGTAAGAGNVIAHNNGKGVVVSAGAGGDAILGNSIFANTGLGIDLGDDGVTTNGTALNPASTNSGMDFPVFTSVSLTGATLTVAGHVGSAAGQASFANARVEIFASDNSAGGYGQGLTYLGFLTTDSSGNFTGTLAAGGLVAGDTITGTGTDLQNDSSEFGANATVSGAISASSTVLTASADPSVYGQSVTFTATTSVVAPGVGVPVGTVTFSDGGTVLGSSALLAGVATFTTSTLSAGSHDIVAKYTGNPLFGSSASSTLIQMVSQRAISVAADAQAKTYGNSDPALTYRITAGSLVGSDSFSGSLSRVAGESVGNYAIGQGTLDLGANYLISFAGSSLAISRRAISVAADAQAKTYGDADPTLTYRITAGGVVGTDSFSGSLSRAAGESVGSYAIGQGTLTLGADYAISFAGSSLAISRLAIGVAADPQSKVYGDPDPALTYRLTAGALVSGDSFTGTPSRVAGESVGGYAIGQGSLSLGANYALSFAGSSLAISRRAIGVAADAQAKLVGDPDPALTYRVTAGSLVGSDAFSGSPSRAAGESAGSYAIGQGSLALSADYALSFAGSSLTISSRPGPPPPPTPGPVVGAVPPSPSGPQTTPTVPPAPPTGPNNTVVRLSPAAVAAVPPPVQGGRSDALATTVLPTTLVTATLPASAGPRSTPRGAVNGAEPAALPARPTTEVAPAPVLPVVPPPIAANVGPAPGVVPLAPVPGPAPTGRAVASVGVPWDRLETKAPELEEDRLSSNLSAGGVAGVLMTVGYVLLNSRAGMWLLSLLTTTPLWKQFDPLEVLQEWKKRKTRVKGSGSKGEGGDEETLQSLVGRGHRPTAPRVPPSRSA